MLETGDIGRFAKVGHFASYAAAEEDQSAMKFDGWSKAQISLHKNIVAAYKKALGEQLSPKEQQPEIFRWTDGSLSHVTCEFANGKLVKWALFRPPAEPEAVPAVVAVAMPQAPEAAGH